MALPVRFPPGQHHSNNLGWCQTIERAPSQSCRCSEKASCNQKLKIYRRQDIWTDLDHTQGKISGYLPNWPFRHHSQSIPKSMSNFADASLYCNAMKEHWIMYKVRGTDIRHECDSASTNSNTLCVEQGNSNPNRALKGTCKFDIGLMSH